VIVNVGEDDLDREEEIAAELEAKFEGKGRALAVMGGKFEMELNELDGDEAGEFRQSVGVTESGLEESIRLSYQLLGLISFLTSGEDECRAWSVASGSTAPVAAGKIHTDLQRGFIRAEVVSYDDLVRCGSEAEAKKQGLVRTEGKDYVVKDGDILHVLFNV
jgi:ribosome-binding ATPase